MNIFEEIKVSKIDSIALIDNTAKEKRFINNRFAYAVSFCLSGQITYHFEDKDYISDPNHVVFIPMGKTYYITCEKSGVFPIINFYCCEDLTHFGFCSMKIENTQYYFKSFENLRKTFSLHNSTRDIKALAIFYDMLSRIAGENINSICPCLRPALEFLEANYTDPNLTNKVLAEQSNISEVYFRKLFFEVFSIPPHKYIQQLRISKAKELLKNNRLSINEISESCGYSSVYHFCRAFKTCVGQSAGQFRKNFSTNIF
ncbi:MAG: AraC family transcriptional regulator [Acutalibacteraceae bacterium]|nr:AraC family transcriptional regulator [Acutalibacteraceae bacterium]